MPSPLENLAGIGKPLLAEPADAKELAGLKRGALNRLKDAGNPELELESRFDLAYSASFALCLAALRHHGYRPQQRYIVFQVLPHTLGLGPEVWRVLDKGHEIRNEVEYEGSDRVTEQLVADIIDASRIVIDKLDALPPIKGLA